MKIKTDRLVIRSLRFSDDENLFDMCRDEATALSAGWKPHKTLQVTRNVLANHIYSDETYAVLLHNKTFIGTISLYDNKTRDVKMRELGFCQSKYHRKNGYMKEAIDAIINFAFINLNIDLLTVCHATFNYDCENLIKKTPFVYEGTLIGYRIVNSSIVCDCKMYSLKKENY